MRLQRVLAVFLCVAAFALFPAVSFADTSFSQLLGQLEQQYQLPSGILWKVALVESGGNPTVCASTSSACGMFQFITSTWESATKAMFGAPLDPSLRSSPDVSAKVAAYNLAVINSQIGSTISQAKVDLSAGLYLGHFLGSGGARTLLLAYMQNPGQSACALLPPQCASNRSILSQSVSGVINWASQKMQVSGVPNIPGNFADAQGISYAYSYADISSSNFLPANTVIPANPYGQYATVFPSVTNTPLSPTTAAGTAIPGAPQTALPSSYTSAPAAAAPAAATNPSACTPQYSCSNGTVTYQSDSCTTSVFQTCQYGCLGTICAPNPSASTTSSGAVNGQPLVTGVATSAFGALGTSGSFLGIPTEIGTTSMFSIDSTMYIGGSGNVNDANATSAPTGAQAAYGQETFTSDFDQSYQTQASSPLFQLLGELKTALGGLLTYLQSL